MSAEVHVNGRRATHEVIQYEAADGVATIWLNRPEVKNCVNWELLTNLGAALERAEDDDDVQVVLIRGSGHKFCAGAVGGRGDAIQPRQADDRGRRGLRRRRRL